MYFEGPRVDIRASDGLGESTRARCFGLCRYSLDGKMTAFFLDDARLEYWIRLNGKFRFPYCTPTFRNTLSRRRDVSRLFLERNLPPLTNPDDKAFFAWSAS